MTVEYFESAEIPEMTGDHGDVHYQRHVRATEVNSMHGIDFFRSEHNAKLQQCERHGSGINYTSHNDYCFYSCTVHPMSPYFLIGVY